MFWNCPSHRYDVLVASSACQVTVMSNVLPVYGGIDLPIDRLSDVGQAATRRLTVLRRADDELLAQP